LFFNLGDRREQLLNLLLYPYLWHCNKEPVSSAGCGKGWAALFVMRHSLSSVSHPSGPVMRTVTVLIMGPGSGRAFFEDAGHL
jgi:hypothetical protein